VAPQELLFGQALQRYCGGQRDRLTLEALQAQR
jgi:hypothetical protein